jgi:hypothetical protein
LGRWNRGRRAQALDWTDNGSSNQVFENSSAVALMAEARTS